MAVRGDTFFLGTPTHCVRFIRFSIDHYKIVFPRAPNHSLLALVADAKESRNAHAPTTARGGERYPVVPLLARPAAAPSGRLPRQASLIHRTPLRH